MEQAKKNATELETLDSSHKSLLCWKSILSGFLITTMSFLLLTSLGAGIGGEAASGVIANEEGGSALATFAGLWLGLSCVISLFLGSYFTLRVARYVTPRIGAAHGFIVASLFFILMVTGAGRLLGHVSRGIGQMTHALGAGGEELSKNPMIQDLMHTAMSSAPLKSDPDEVARGLTARLMRGDTESAKSYYAYQTGLQPAEVDAKVAQLKTNFEEKMKSVGDKAAHAVADAGWSLFVTFFVGLIAAMIGGRVGAKANHDRPFARYRVETADALRPVHAQM